MSNKDTSGLGLGTILFLIFLILKLTNLINWSWWWVFAPFWMPFAIIFLLFILVFLYHFFKALFI